jgi:hypothetical protein
VQRFICHLSHRSLLKESFEGSGDETVAGSYFSAYWSTGMHRTDLIRHSDCGPCLQRLDLAPRLLYRDGNGKSSHIDRIQPRKTRRWRIVARFRRDGWANLSPKAKLKRMSLEVPHHGNTYPTAVMARRIPRDIRLPLNIPYRHLRGIGIIQLISLHFPGKENQIKGRGSHHPADGRWIWQIQKRKAQ